MKIFVLGGDGFCGWPTALHLSRRGHDVTIIDNFSRRAIDKDLGIESLTPIAPLEERCVTWEEVSGEMIEAVEIDIAADFSELLSLIVTYEPDVIVHFAEQRAAPFSMKTVENKRYTVGNNVMATHNVLAAIAESQLDVHLVHLGTMGVYGYGTAGDTLPEGYFTVAPIKSDRSDPDWADVGVSREIRYPANPGSVYHMTKCLDAEMFAFYAKNDKLRITDLHQGIIWGTNTVETLMHPALINRFDYDGDYGTVLNRFIVQAAIGHPLTVHGTGGQTRAFIHIQNSVQCIELAIRTPPNRGDRVMIFNQMTETHRVIDLAQKVSAMTGVSIAPMANPRNEASENELRVSNEQFLSLGLEPITLDDRLIDEVLHVATKYADRINRDKIVCTSTWSPR